MSKIENELILIINFGGQYNHLISRRVRDFNVYCEIIEHDTPLEEIIAKKPKGIIFTGGPSVIYEDTAPTIDKAIFDSGIPIFGICYGCQLMSHLLGGKVEKASHREYGRTPLTIKNNNKLFQGLQESTECWMSHTYYVSKPPLNFEVIGSTETCPTAGIANEDKKIYGVQFHPEVNHTPQGLNMLKNFLFNICECKGDWVMNSFTETKIQEIKEKIGDKKALCALSGGVDSSVAALMVYKAIGKNLTCIFVDHGLLRKNEGDEVEKIFTENFDMNFIRVNVQDLFLGKLKGITDPETKRKIIGSEFIKVFEAEAKKIGKIDYLVQGTIYPDVVESGTKNGAVIKSHHNVGGLPDVIDFKELVEPLRDLYKDEVRNVGLELGLPEFLVKRQPFPGPGLAIRIIGEITEEKLEIVRNADFIYREEIKNAGLDKVIWQYFAALTNMQSVGVMGDERTYGHAIVLRGVLSSDGMTADWAKIPHDVLEKISTRIVNEVHGINRVMYDITSKPPATIEYE